MVYTHNDATIFIASRQMSAAESSGELFVFSTPYDRLLPAHLASQAGARVSLFRTRRAGSNPKSRPLALLQTGTGCLPGAWALRRDAAPASAGAAAPGGPLRLEEEPLEVRLL